MIEEYFDYLPVAFSVGAQKNAQGENEGSAKVFSFARFANLEAEPTLQLLLRTRAGEAVRGARANEHLLRGLLLRHGRRE